MTNNTQEGSFGFLRFAVGAASNTIPLEGATVYVYTDPGNGDEGRLLYTLTTDGDGLTETVTLPTPPLSESFSPEYPKPYSTYNIYASKQGYYPTEGRTVPLFPGITSIQPINMIPVSQMPGAPARWKKARADWNHE
ncbi:MAG: hypothetical protein IJ386_10000 [Clostridia bacterium]|nr:hypothetical protein [Clostridia bacterium]